MLYTLQQQDTCQHLHASRSLREVNCPSSVIQHAAAIQVQLQNSLRNIQPAFWHSGAYHGLLQVKDMTTRQHITLDSRSTTVKWGISAESSLRERFFVMPACSNGAKSSCIAAKSVCLAGLMPCRAAKTSDIARALP